MSSNTYTVQYKGASNQQWQTKVSGASEASAFSTLERLRESHPFARIIDKDGKLVAS